MARDQSGRSDSLCALHLGLIDDWEKASEDALSRDGNCSWCLKKTTHKFKAGNTLQRLVYECTNCEKKTLPCRKCDSSFARGHSRSYIADWTCLKCAEIVKTWGDTPENLAVTQRYGWCSCCFERSIHELEAANVLGRHRYRCTSCRRLTLPCVMCAKAFVGAGATWNAKVCAMCINPKALTSGTTWEAVYRRKRDLFSAPREPLRHELGRSSKYRAKAANADLTRPFLVLSGMPAQLRTDIAAVMGQSHVIRSYFGDAHAEAWHILHDKTSLQDRATQALQTLTLRQNDRRWTGLLRRILTEVLETRLPASDRVTGCIDIEDVFMSSYLRVRAFTALQDREGLTDEFRGEDEGARGGDGDRTDRTTPNGSHTDLTEGDDNDDDVDGAVVAGDAPPAADDTAQGDAATLAELLHDRPLHAALLPPLETGLPAVPIVMQTKRRGTWTDLSLGGVESPQSEAASGFGEVSEDGMAPQSPTSPTGSAAGGFRDSVDQNEIRLALEKAGVKEPSLVEFYSHAIARGSINQQREELDRSRPRAVSSPMGEKARPSILKYDAGVQQLLDRIVHPWGVVDWITSDPVLRQSTSEVVYFLPLAVAVIHYRLLLSSIDVVVPFS